jgi:hypothetical protein
MGRHGGNDGWWRSQVIKGINQRGFTAVKPPKRQHRFAINQKDASIIRVREYFVFEALDDLLLSARDSRDGAKRGHHGLLETIKACPRPKFVLQARRPTKAQLHRFGWRTNRQSNGFH